MPQSSAGILNLQNINRSKIVRNLLVSDPDWERALHPDVDARDIRNLNLFISCDYSQQEIRILAEISGDELLIRQLQTGRDIHCLVGNTLTGYSEDRIRAEKELRARIKAIVFGIVYGSRPNSLFRQMVHDGIDVSLSEVERLYNEFFNTYTGVKRYIERQHRRAERLGYVDTLFGPFRRYIRTQGDSRGTYWGNQAVNTPIQGSAHQFLLAAMALLDMEFDKYNELQDPCLEVHDELVFFVQLGRARKAYRQLKALFEVDVPRYLSEVFSYAFRVPFVSECEAGFSFGARVRYEGESSGHLLEAWRKQHREVEQMSCRELMPKPLQKRAARGGDRARSPRSRKK